MGAGQARGEFFICSASGTISYFGSFTIFSVGGDAFCNSWGVVGVIGKCCCRYQWCKML